MHAADDAQIKHLTGCDIPRHTDPADHCYTKQLEVQGVPTHLDLTNETAHSPLAPGMSWTATGCFALAARFAELGQHLLHVRH